MVEVYGKKARQINSQDPAHRRAYTWINTQCKERRKEVEEKKGRIKTSSSREGIRTHNPHLRGKAPVCIATFTLHKDTWLQLLYKYHEGYILNSIAQYPLHMMERERDKVS